MSKKSEIEVEDVLAVGAGILMGVAVPGLVFAGVVAAAPVAGSAATTWALKRIGFGAMKRAPLVLGGIGAMSGTVADGTVRAAASKIKQSPEAQAVEA